MSDLTDAQTPLRRIRDGASFILDAPDHVPAVWGDGDQVLWAEGESLMLVGPPGVGKTTIAGQLIKGRQFGGTVLGLPVQPTSSRVLYLAMDRPAQIARSLRRAFREVEREPLSQRLAVWEGPPPADLARHPEVLLYLASEAGADTIVVDSVKDAAIGLTEDETAAGYNRARQLVLAEGVQLLELHHQVKRGANGGPPNTLADVYGSAWLTAGAGSVVLLWGAAGDPIVQLLHLKQPAEEFGPVRVMHDHEAGTSSVWHGVDLVQLAKKSGGVTAKDAARAIFDSNKPSHSETEKARRRLDALVKAGTLMKIPGDDATQTPTRWTLTDTLTAPPQREDPHDLNGPSRSAVKPQVGSLTDTLTTLPQQAPSRISPPLKGGDREAPLCRVCGTTLSPVLIDGGVDVHPLCEEEAA